ncbi:MAG TPA: response regulator [Planctomycetaceae bacterium]|nr:response regulator [Planctomycetaceae bacterium]HIQ22276.1 response regulator [Planctomycetota bacterium]
MAETSRRVLVAEDNAAMADVIRFNLERAGMEVVTARSGDVAWGLFNRQSFDLVVSDFQMPGMTGGQLCQRIRDAGWSEIPLILLTAKSFEVDTRRYLEDLAVTAIISKPFSPRELTRLVKESLAACVMEAMTAAWKMDGHVTQDRSSGTVAAGHRLLLGFQLGRDHLAGGGSGAYHPVGSSVPGGEHVSCAGWGGGPRRTVVGAAIG